MRRWPLLVSSTPDLVSVWVFQGTAAVPEVTKKIRDKCQMWKVAQVHDETCCPQETIGQLHTHVVKDATEQVAKDAGVDFIETPFPSGEQLREFKGGMDKAIDLNADIRPSEFAPGYLMGPAYCVETVIDGNPVHVSLDLTSNARDTVCLALGTDKAPYQHNGRSMILASVSSTFVRKCQYRGSLRRFEDSRPATILKPAFRHGSGQGCTFWISDAGGLCKCI